MSDSIQPSSHLVRIALTDPQRQRIRERTGHDLTEISVHDPDGWISANMKGLLPIEVEKLAYRYLDRQGDQEAIDALKAAQAAEEKKALEESNKKAAALLKETEKEAKEIEAAVTAAFAVEAQAVEAAREAAKSAKAAADAAAAAAAKKKR
jgi:hypothetical protein